MVLAMGTVVTAIAIAKQDGSRISSQDRWQLPEDGGDGQNVHYLLLPKPRLVIRSSCNYTWLNVCEIYSNI